MKPILIIAGAPQSYTSVISKFLLDNGGFSNDLFGNPNDVLDYERFESKSLEDFVKAKRTFGDYDLSDFFKSLPDDEVVILKLPFIIQFINELPKYTDRELKVIYAMRNPQNIIMSSMKKSKKTFIYNFERIVWFYDFLVDCELPSFPLITEQILKKNPHTSKMLLDFCSLPSEKINYSSVDDGRISKRKPSYLKYRFSNFVWKRLAFLFRVYK